MLNPKAEDLQSEVQMLDAQIKELLEKRDKLRNAVDDIIERSDNLKVVAERYKEVLGVNNEAG